MSLCPCVRARALGHHEPDFTPKKKVWGGGDDAPELL